MSTSVGPLGSGIGGGVELTLRTLAGGLSKMGHSVTVVAPLGSVLTLSESNSASERSGIGAVRLMEVAGALHVPSQTRDRSAPLSVPANSVLQNMWHRVIELAGTERFDVVLNFAYDVLPFSEADAIGVPVTHLVSMGSLSDEMDLAVRSVMTTHPGCVAMHSRAQAETFGTDVASGVTIVGSGI
ncbi:MAG: UDP-glucose--tetrahydrobiopterin glucosyltransferase, partial [Ilumatobacteraceae bacterium]